MISSNQTVEETKKGKKRPSAECECWVFCNTESLDVNSHLSPSPVPEKLDGEKENPLITGGVSGITCSNRAYQNKADKHESEDK